MAEDAEEAAKKLNHKEFFGKVVSVTVAKPKKRGILLFLYVYHQKKQKEKKKKKKKKLLSQH